VGYALATVGAYRDAVRWLNDHAGRSGVEPWMLLNLVIALRATGADQQARQLGRRALELPADKTSPFHRIWMALDEALAGDAAAAQELLIESDPSAQDPTHRFLCTLVDCMCDVQETPAAERGPVFADVRRQLRQAAADATPLVQDRPAVRRAYRKGIRRIAKDVGGLSAAVWCLWRRMFPLLPKRR
jgi:hypothetical protein